MEVARCHQMSSYVLMVETMNRKRGENGPHYMHDTFIEQIGENVLVLMVV